MSHHTRTRSALAIALLAILAIALTGCCFYDPCGGYRCYVPVRVCR